MDASVSTSAAKPSRFRTLVSKLLKNPPTKAAKPSSNQPDDAAPHTILLSKLRKPSPTKATNNATAHTTISTPSTLQTLPLELLQIITSHLTPVDAACLSLTNQHFKTSLPFPPLPPRSRRCANWLLATRLETDLLSSLPPNAGLPSHLMCCYCKLRHPLHTFTGVPRLSLSHFNPLNLGKPVPTFTAPDRLSTRPEQRACGFHEPEVTWVPEPGCACMAQGRKRYWLRWMDLVCLHCGAVVAGGGDGREGVGEWLRMGDDGELEGPGVRGHGRQTGCSKCLCEICPRRPMETFERYGPLAGGWGGDYPEIKGVIRTSDGQLKIVEKGAWKPFFVRDAHPHGELPAGDGGHDEGDDEDGEEGDAQGDSEFVAHA